jgi:ElaB/YqjD/DUF883 family membrane-anchored ribosome-binding protein
MNSDPTPSRPADDTTRRQPAQGSRNGEAASGAVAAARRAVRRRHLEDSRGLTMALLGDLALGVDGKLPPTAQDCVDRLKDPFLAMNRVQRELRRIIAQEERLDDEDTERANDPAAEAAERAQAAIDAEVSRKASDRSQAEKQKKDAIREAVTQAARDAWGDADKYPDCLGDDCLDDECEGLPHLLDDLFSDYESYDDYAGDPVEIVAKLCAQFGLKPGADTSAESEDDDADPEVAAQARALDLARFYLRRAGLELAETHGPPDG